MVKPASIDDYIQAAPVAGRTLLREIRKRVKDLVPDASETIGYNVPAFRRGRIFIYFAAFKNHIRINPPVTDDAALVNELREFRGPKGNLKIPYSGEPPFELIDRVIIALAEHYGA